MLFVDDSLKITSDKFTKFSDKVLAGNIESQYVEAVRASDHYPNKMKLSLLVDVDCGDMEVLGAAREFVEDVKEHYEVDCHLCAYYPPGGFIDWHTNENIETYNAICTYSHTGNSYFQYKKDGQVTTVPDKFGWSVKKTKWSKQDPLWHRAESNDDRITVTFSSNKEENIDRLIRDIT